MAKEPCTCNWRRTKVYQDAYPLAGVTYEPNTNSQLLMASGTVSAIAPGYIGFQIKANGTLIGETQMFAKEANDNMTLPAIYMPLDGVLAPGTTYTITVEPHSTHGGNTQIGTTDWFTITVAELEPM